MVIINRRNLKKGVHIGKKTLSLFLSALLCLQPLTVYAESDVEESIEIIEEEIESDDVEINDNDAITEETESNEIEENTEELISQEMEVTEENNDSEVIENEVLESTEDIEIDQSEIDEGELKIQEFIDFVNNLPSEITEDNVEHIGEQVNMALDMYEELVDLGLNNNDVECYINKVYELYARIDTFYDSSNLALNTGHKISVRFCVLIVDSKYNTGYAYGLSESTKFICQYSVAHSDTAYNNHTIAISDIRAASQRLSIPSGYDIVGWSKSASQNPTIYSLYLSGTTACNKGDTIYIVVKSTNKTFTLNYNANGGNNAPSTQTATNTDTSHNFTISSQQPSRDGYNFLGWVTTSNATVPTYFGGDSINVNNSTTLYAVWKEESAPKTYIVVYTDGVIGETIFSDQGYEDLILGQETPQFISEPTREGYEFIGWKLISAVTDEIGIHPTIQNQDADETATIIYEAQWKEIGSPSGVTQYTVVYMDGSNELVFINESYQSLSLNDNTPPFSQTPQREGYKFIGWKLISVASNKNEVQPTIQDEDADDFNTIIYEAQWKEIKYKVSWYDEDKETYLDSNTFSEDEEEPSYTQELPTKESDSKYDYVFKKWIKREIPLNDDDISYVAFYDVIPKKFSYTITHEYYTDGILDGSESNSEDTEVDTIISEAEITRNLIYDGNTYKYISITPSTLQIKPMPSTNEFVLRYDRYSYKVIHKYLNKEGDLDGETEETFYALEDDEIETFTLQQPLYNDELYPYKEDSGNLIVSTTKDSNVITITYQKEKQLPKETSYLIKWMDIDENELKSEIRDGFIDDVKTPLDEDYKLDGYTFVETQDNILSISLKEDENTNILKLYFEKNKPTISESPLPSESPIVSESPLPSEKPSESPTVSVQPSESPVVSEKPSQQPSESPKSSETPTVSKSPTISEKPSVSPTPTVSSTSNSTPTPNVESTPNEDKVETPITSTVDIPSTEVPKTSTPKKETTTIADPDMPLSATPTKTADKLDFWIVLSISTFVLLLFLYNRKKH